MISFIFYFGFGVASVNLFGLLFMSENYETLVFHLTYFIAGVLICAITRKNL